MFSYVARQAIFDKNKQVSAYELLFRDGINNCFPNIEPDEATSKILTNSHLVWGLEEITDGKSAFINFHEDTLLFRFPTSLNPMNVVVEIVETVPISEPLLKACKHIHGLGYQIALDDHDFDPKWDDFLPFINIIKVDIQQCSAEKIAANIDRFKQTKIKLIAERIETSEEFSQFLNMGFDYFQGFFFTRPEVIRQKQIPTSKMSLVELMAASATSGFDFNRINDIIERDVSLSYMLMRFINNPIYNKRNKISSLKHALNYMGEVEVKKFIALLALANLADTKPPEIMHVSLVRAKFCELIASSKGDKQDPPTGFLFGLFSMLDALLDQSMYVLVNKIPIDQVLKDALCGRESTLRLYLSVVEAMERAQWGQVTQLANKLELTEEPLHAFYSEAIHWGAALKQTARPNPHT